MTLQVNDLVVLGIDDKRHGKLIEIADGMAVVRLDDGTEVVELIEAISADDGLTVPWFLDCRNNPAVIEGRQRARALPVTTVVTFAVTTQRRDVDAELKAFMDAEKAREEVEKKNGFARLKIRNETNEITIQGGRWDARRGKWITPAQDFAEGAARVDKTVEEFRAIVEAVAADPGPGLAAYCRAVLADLDGGLAALNAQKETDKAVRRAKNRAKRVGLAPARTRRKTRMS